MGHGTPPLSIILLQRDTYGPVSITKGYPSSCQGLLSYPLCSVIGHKYRQTQLHMENVYPKLIWG